MTHTGNETDSKALPRQEANLNLCLTRKKPDQKIQVAAKSILQLILGKSQASCTVVPK